MRRYPLLTSEEVLYFANFFSRKNPDFSWGTLNCDQQIQNFRAKIVKEGTIEVYNSYENEKLKNLLKDELEKYEGLSPLDTESLKKFFSSGKLGKEQLIFAIFLLKKHKDLTAQEIIEFSIHFLEKNPDSSWSDQEIQDFREKISENMK